MKGIKEYLQSVRFVLSYSFRFVRKDTLIGVFINVVLGVLPYATAFLLGRLVDRIIVGTQNTSYQDLWVVLFMYAVVSSLPAITGNFQRYVARRRMSKLQVEMELEILRMRERIDIATYEDPSFLDLLQRTFRNGPNPIYQLSIAQFDFIQFLTSLILGTILAVNFDWSIYLIVIVTAIPAFITDIKFAGSSWSIWAKDSLEQRKYGDLRQHMMSRTLLIEAKLLQASKKMFEWMRKILTDFSQKQIKLEGKKVWITSITDFIALLGFMGGLVLVVKTTLSGVNEIGSIVYMIGTLTSVRKSIANLLESISGQFENHLIVQDMIEIRGTKPEIIESKSPVTAELTHAPEIKLENVGFKYQSSEKWSLRNVNLTFKAGDNIGLVGNNGAGKTTLVKLLCRIYDPTEGRVLINGVDLKEISTKEWWAYLAVMFQDYATYDFQVKDAIGIGRPDKSPNLTKVIEAAHTSQAHTFIEEWEHKYDEQLGVEFKGKEPSKGQRQKLAIAKTLYRDGFVMILDEPTASVDAESEAKIFDSIENLPKDRTAILISHDFSTISQCDKIFVMEEGRLIEEGTHKELMKNKGKYSELYKLQADRFKK